MVQLMKADSGFTLLELMVVVLIGGVLLAVGVPNMTAMVKNNREAAQVNEFVVSLSMARAEAIRRNASVIVCRNNDENAAAPACGTGVGWRDGWSIFVDTNNNSAFNTGEPILLMHGKLMDSTTLTVDASAFTNQLRFTQIGTLGTAATFTLQDDRTAPKGTRKICLSVTGRVLNCGDNL